MRPQYKRQRSGSAHEERQAEAKRKQPKLADDRDKQEIVDYAPSIAQSASASSYATIAGSGSVQVYNVNGNIFQGSDPAQQGGASSSDLFLSNTPLPSQPLPPEMFYGRKGFVTQLATIIVDNPQPRIAILGSGGMGKTSAALHLIHHAAVRSKYNGREYFVGCEATTSAESLALRTLQILGVTPGAKENAITVMHRALASAPPTLLLFDNFESIWDSQNADLDRSVIRDLLQKIAASPSAALIITMRSTVPPPGIRWTFFETLPPLQPPSAKELFLAINDITQQPGNEISILDELLQEVDYVPLAITLLAQVSLGLSLKYVLRQWREKRTSMLRLAGTSRDRLEDIDVSISISIASLDAVKNPEAIQLLGMICLLPDGLFHWQDRLDIIEKHYSTASSAMQILRKFALIYIAGDKMGVLSPIRHFILKYHPADTLHTQCLYDIIWELVDTHALVEFGLDFNNAVEALRPELGNITALIEHVTHSHPSPKVLDIAIKFTWHLLRTHPSTSTLLQVAQLVPTARSRDQARYWEIMGETLRVQRKASEATDAFTQARDYFLKADDRVGAASCLRRLGDIYRSQSKFDDATDALTQARNDFIDINDHRGVSRCSWSLAYILLSQENYPAAEVAFTEARTRSLQAGDRHLAVRCSRNLGDVMRKQKKHIEATLTLKQAHEELLNIGDHRKAAWCLCSLGEIYHMQTKHAEAKMTVMEAHEYFLSRQDREGDASCRAALGNIALVQGRNAEAGKLFKYARDIYSELENQVKAAYCSERLLLCT